jgi:hypothetical protein
MNWLKKIGNRANHNAFVDLCAFNNHLFCCYREAQNHVSADGQICILTLNKNGQVLASQRIIMAHTDLRDPKLSMMPNGHLLLIAYAKQTNANNVVVARKNLSWVSQTGHSWSSAKEFATRGWWLWRVSWHQNIAYGFAYNRRANAIHLYSGHPRRSFHMHQPNVLSLEKHNKGYPNESDIFFEGTKAFAIVRRDADSHFAQLGKSTYPFKKWLWFDLECYIGGPALMPINKDFALVAGRIVKQGKWVTALMKVDLSSGKLKELLVLPSAGDNSYPGLVIENKTLYISYYSSHLDNKSSIYMASIDIDYLMKSNNDVPVTRANVACAASSAVS